MQPSQTRAIVSPDGNLVIRIGPGDAGREYPVALTPVSRNESTSADILAALDAATGSVPDWEFIEPVDPPPAPETTD